MGSIKASSHYDLFRISFKVLHITISHIYMQGPLGFNIHMTAGDYPRVFTRRAD